MDELRLKGYLCFVSLDHPFYDLARIEGDISKHHLRHRQEKRIEKEKKRNRAKRKEDC